MASKQTMLSMVMIGGVVILLSGADGKQTQSNFFLLLLLTYGITNRITKSIFFRLR